MGVITDFFLASTTDVARILTGWHLPAQTNRLSPESQPAKSACDNQTPAHVGFVWQQPPRPNPSAVAAPKIDLLPNVQCRGMLPEKLALLFAALTEIPTDHAMDLILLGYLTGPPETEVTVQRLPTALTNALAVADSADLARAARILEEDDIDRWGNVCHGTAKEQTDVLRRIQSLAKRGLSTNADLFVWTCT
jgi:hypothetical protein